MESTRNMELERPGSVDLISGVKGYPHASDRISGQTVAPSAPSRLAFACRQSGSGTRNQRPGFGKSTYDAGAASSEICLGQERNSYSFGMDSLCGEQVRRCAVATLLPRRLADTEAASAFRRGWNDGSERRFPLSAGGRAPNVRTQASIPRIVEPMEPRRSPTLVSCGRPDTGDAPQAPRDARASVIAHPEVAASGLVPQGVTNGIASARTGRSTAGDMGWASSAQPELEAPAGGSEPRIGTRAAGRMVLADAALERMGALRPTRGLLRSSQLLADFAWSTRTERSRNSQWKAWVEFCTAENRALLPATEAHFVAFIGWLASEREARRRQVGSSSLAQYFSAVRQMQVILTGVPVPTYPFVAHVTRAYARWEEENYPQKEVRVGVSASVVQAIWGFGMQTGDPSKLRDAAMVMFAYCFNGLRESSVLTLRADNVELQGDQMMARLSFVKGQIASHVPLVRYHRMVQALPSPVDLWLRWKNARGRHRCFFGLQGERDRLPEQALTLALQRCLQAVGVKAPVGGKYTSHSLRIGAHTEQVLLGIPLEVRLARFGWGPRSAEMAATYFDRTVVSSAASFWLFGKPFGTEHPVAPATV